MYKNTFAKDLYKIRRITDFHRRLWYSLWHSVFNHHLWNGYYVVWGGFHGSEGLGCLPGYDTVQPGIWLPVFQRNLLSSFSALSWRWRQQVPLKYWCDITWCQKTTIQMLYNISVMLHNNLTFWWGKWKCIHLYLGLLLIALVWIHIILNAVNNIHWILMFPLPRISVYLRDGLHTYVTR
jgi:hypothetical protein